MAALPAADVPVELVPWGGGVAAELVAEAGGAVVVTVLVTEAVLEPPLDPHAPTAAASSDAVTVAAAYISILFQSSCLPRRLGPSQDTSR